MRIFVLSFGCFVNTHSGVNLHGKGIKMDGFYYSFELSKCKLPPILGLFYIKIHVGAMRKPLHNENKFQL